MTGSSERRARLYVAPELARHQAFRLPPGFARGEERMGPIVGGPVVEMTIIGPFGTDLPEVDDQNRPPLVQASIGVRQDGSLNWQWRYQGKAIGEPIEVPPRATGPIYAEPRSMTP